MRYGDHNSALLACDCGCGRTQTYSTMTDTRVEEMAIRDGWRRNGLNWYALGHAPHSATSPVDVADSKSTGDAHA